MKISLSHTLPWSSLCISSLPDRLLPLNCISHHNPPPSTAAIAVISTKIQALEKEKGDLQTYCRSTFSSLQAETNEPDEVVGDSDKSKRLTKFIIDDSLDDSFLRLQSAKRELATKLRELVVLKRLADDVPTQAELIQYERRFSELNFHIQRKLRQTRKYYATYNALLEIKDLILKETSLLNSNSSQKLQKVQLTQQAEQKACEALKEKHARANAEQRRCYALLKAFQEECAKNERLRNQTSKKFILFVSSY